MKLAKWAALAALTLGIAAPAMAQQQPMQGHGRAGVVEVALRLREQLKLTPTQVQQLEALRQEIVAQRQNQSREMIDLQSRMAAGMIERDALRTQMQARRDELRKTTEQRRERIEQILTQEQRDQIGEQMRKHERGMRDGRPGRPGRPGQRPHGEGGKQ